VGIGHVAVGFALKRSEPRLNLGILVFSALLLDFLLGIFALLGLKRAHIPPNYAHLHYLTFTFPCSHGLAASFVWSAFAFACVMVLCRGETWGNCAGLLAAVAVFSHFPLDALVHTPKLPVFGEASPKIGLSLWNHLALELCLETLMFAAGLILLLRFSGLHASRGRRLVFIIFMLAFAVAAVLGQALSTVPPTAATLKTS
jgi:hypothetical protein